MPLLPDAALVAPHPDRTVRAVHVAIADPMPRMTRRLRMMLFRSGLSWIDRCRPSPACGPQPVSESSDRGRCAFPLPDTCVFRATAAVRRSAGQRCRGVRDAGLVNRAHPELRVE